MGKKIELVGLRFGRLVVLDFANKLGNQFCWLCKCDCGNTKIILGTNLKQGYTQSCGCLQKESASSSNSTHRMTKERVHTIWVGMLARCGNPNNPSYKNYGGRGIFVCDKWKDFQSFFADMGDPPSKSHSIDRKDVNIGYEPDNCRWATVIEQANNTRANRIVLFDEQKWTLSDLCRQKNMNYKTVHRRLSLGWSLEKAINTPTFYEINNAA